MNNLFNELREDQITEIRELFDEFAKENYLVKDGEVYIDHVFLDRRDIEAIREIAYDMFKKGSTVENIIDKLVDDFIFYDSDIDTEYMENKFLKEYREQLDNIHDNLDNDIFRDEIVNIFNQYDFEELKEIINSVELYVIIMLETSDSINRELENNRFGAIFNTYHLSEEEDFESLKEELYDSSLRVLLEKQGYTLDQYIQYIRDSINGEKNSLREDKAFRSIACEVDDAYNNVGLSVLREMSYEEYLELLKEDTITINKDDTIGYVGYIYGDGSSISIQLRQNMEYKKDEFKVILDGEYGYSIENIYGSFL